MKTFIILLSVAALSLCSCTNKSHESDKTSQTLQEQLPAEASQSDSMPATDVQANNIIQPKEMQIPEPKTDPHQQARQLLASVPYTETGLKSLLPEDRPLTQTEYEALMLSYANCQLSPDGSMPDAASCATELIFRTVKIQVESKDKLSTCLALLDFDSDIVRLAAATELPATPNQPDTDKQILNRLQKETNPTIIAALLNKFTGRNADSSSIHGFIKANASHQDPRVRLAITKTMGYPNIASKNPDLIDTLIAMTNDTDAMVKQSAIGNLGLYGNDKVLSILSEILEDPEQADFQAQACSALQSPWLDAPNYRNNNEQAYRITMNYLNKSPRTKAIPSPNAIRFAPSASPGFQKWLQKSPWFHMEEYLSNLSDIVRDNDANIQTRLNALEIINRFGTPASLKDIEKQIKSSTPESPEGKAEKEKLLKKVSFFINKK